jgi:anthranilate synthase component 1
MSAIYTKTIVADGLTPVQAYANLRAKDPQGASFLFESVVGGERWGRYTILGYRPTYEARLLRTGWEIEGEAPPRPLRAQKPGEDPLAVIADLVRNTADTPPKSVAEKLARSHIGYLAWDIVHVVEKVPPGKDETWKSHFVPLARLFGGATVVVFDALSQTVTIAATAQMAVDRAIADLLSAPHALLREIQVPDRAKIPNNVTVDLADEDYEARVLLAKEYIAAGDAFQIVLARTFSVPAAGRDPFDVYRALRLINPSPYMYYLDLPPAHGETTRTQIAGASPETMVRLEDGTMTVRPLAGTRPRGKTDEEDRAREAELLADPKERAEHVMHIVSEVRGRVAPTTPPMEVVRAAFPAGTLSGAPKIRAMQIIRELEARPRNVYGGAVGYVADTGDLDFAIAIRTTTCKSGVFEVTAGAGLVEASNPNAEADETRNKARGVLCAIEAVPGRA